MVQRAVAGTPLYEEPILHGDKETVQRKRSRGTIASGSHRPDFVMESKQQKERGRPRKITFDRALNYEEQVFDVNAVTTDDENHGEISPNAKTTTSNSEFVVPHRLKLKCKSTIGQLEECHHIVFVSVLVWYRVNDVQILCRVRSGGSLFLGRTCL